MYKTKIKPQKASSKPFFCCTWYVSWSSRMRHKREERSFYQQQCVSVHVHGLFEFWWEKQSPSILENFFVSLFAWLILGVISRKCPAGGTKYQPLTWNCALMLGGFFFLCKWSSDLVIRSWSVTLLRWRRDLTSNKCYDIKKQKERKKNHTT